MPARARTTRPTSSAPDKRPTTVKPPTPVAGAAAELRRVIESSPQDQLRKLFDSLPGAQMRKALEALPETQVRKALASMPSVRLREAVNRMNAPHEEIKRSRKPPEDARDWINKSDFASSEALAGLIDPMASVKKKVR